MCNNHSYFMRRAAQERSAADHAAGDKARKAHEVMADRYRALGLAAEALTAADTAA